MNTVMDDIIVIIYVYLCMVDGVERVLGRYNICVILNSRTELIPTQLFINIGNIYIL